MTARTIALATLALLGCTKKDSDPKPAPDPPAAAKPDAAPAKPIVTLTNADRALTRPVSAAALVVVRADGTITLAANRETGDLDLTAVMPGNVVPLDQLETEARTMLVAVSDGYHRDGGPRDCGGGIGMGRFGTVTDGGRQPAGLRGHRHEDACHQLIPLVLADAAAPAQRVIDVLSALTRAEVAVAVDGETRARMLPIAFDHLIGDAAPLPEDLELGFTIRADGVSGAAYRGATADAASWTWTGALGDVGAAPAQGRAVEGFGEANLRIRVAPDVLAGALIAAIANLLAGGAERIAIGEAADQAPRYGVGGGNHRHKGPIPSMSLLPPKITGAYDQATARRYLKRRFPMLKYCYEKQLAVNPALVGLVTATFTISEAGLVTASAATGVDPTVSSCVAGVIQAIEFPKPKVAASSGVEAVFTYAPTGG